jgi:hypothetical protein
MPRRDRGRFRYVRTSMWLDADFVRLSAGAKLVLVALSTGSHSNLAGIGLLHREILARETGLSADELEAALAELEKRPTPKRSLITRDHLGVVWVRRFLADDPSRDNDPEVRNPKHRRAVEVILGTLPSSSSTVKKFRDCYKFRAHTLSHRVSQGVSGRVSHTPGASPEIGDRRSENGEQKQEGRRESEGGNQEIAVAHQQTLGDESPRPPLALSSHHSSIGDNGREPLTTAEIVQAVTSGRLTEDEGRTRLRKLGKAP